MFTTMISRLVNSILVLALIVQLFQPAYGARKRNALRRTGTVTVSVTPNHPANIFSPQRALGAGIDGHEKGENAIMHTPEKVAAMLSAGFRPLTYRLRTELGIEAWHWNPRGTWSDPSHEQGYWTSDDQSDSPITVCYGYRLPRRGSTIDQANDDGYSRLDDGDTSTFWKSNPYLDEHFTEDDNSLHPQWVVIDLGQRMPIDAIRLQWAKPYATHYAVEYWQGPDAIYIDENEPGRWVEFPQGEVRQGAGGNQLLRLSSKPIAVRFVRVSMYASSGTAPAGANDIRDRLGYAMSELYLGVMDQAGRFHDLIRHAANKNGQTITYTSSTDPWHRASDIDYRVEQPGFDAVFSSGLTNNLPMLTPVGVLYDTPDNATAEMRYLRARGYMVERVEMGEEPDGQYVIPEDYSALYVQFADALHKVDPKLQLGGPCFETFETAAQAWPDRNDNRSWMKRFLAYLGAHNHLDDFKFFSFEWYPFDDVCAPTAPQLLQVPEKLTVVLNNLIKDGLPTDIPWLITEYGYSAFAGRAEVDIEGALLNAEVVGLFLTLGGDEAYLYGYESGELSQELPCTWGNLMLFMTDRNGKIKYRMPTYYGARLLTQEWAQPSDLPHEVYPAASDIRNSQGQALVTAYAVHRPDGQWALMLINKDPKNSWTVRVRFLNTLTKELALFHGPIDLYQYSSAQYVWHADKSRGRPVKDLPPQHIDMTAAANTSFKLPPFSLTIVRGAR